jgi:hypothetical protein
MVELLELCFPPPTRSEPSSVESETEHSEAASFFALASNIFDAGKGFQAVVVLHAVIG